MKIKLYFLKINENEIKTTDYKELGKFVRRNRKDIKEILCFSWEIPKNKLKMALEYSVEKLYELKKKGIQIMNIVILMGRMVRNPELKYTSSGKAYASFTLAVQKNKNEAEFIDCTAWEKTAETIAEYFKKGSKILIQGRLSVSDYEKNGEKRRFTRVLANSFEFVESKNTVNNQSNKNDYDETEDDDDSFPF